jgi:hypothetical protein
VPTVKYPAISVHPGKADRAKTLPRRPLAALTNVQCAGSSPASIEANTKTQSQAPEITHGGVHIILPDFSLRQGKQQGKN